MDDNRVVNIAVLVSLPILSAILFEYWHDYHQYFSSVVSKWVSAILFQLFFGNTRYQYFCQQAAPLRLLHNNDRGTTSRVSARTQGDVGPKLHAMDMCCDPSAPRMKE